MLSALRVVEGAIVTVSGVLGVEVGTERLWRRCDELGLSRLVLVNLLDRERADFFAALEPLRERLSDQCVAVEIPIGSEHDFHGVVDLVHMVAYLHGDDASGHDESVPIPDDMKQLADEYHDQLMDVVAETSDELMERYLEGGEITREEMAEALKQLVTEGQVFPVGCGAATRNIGSHGLLDLIVEGLPSPAARDQRAGVGRRRARWPTCSRRSPTPTAARSACCGCSPARSAADTQLVNSRTHGKERMGQLLLLQGKDHTPADELGPGMIGAVAKLKDTNTGDVLADVDKPAPVEPIALPAPVVSFAIEAKSKGDEDKVYASLRRLQEEDPSLDVHRDEETGETIVGGLSQMHVETVLERMHRRFGVEVDAEAAAGALPRDDPQAGARAGPPQEADRRPRPVRRLPDRDRAAGRPRGLRVRRQDRRRRDPAGLPAGGRQGHPGGDAARASWSGAPVVGMRVRLVDGSYHNVDSSEMAFKIAGSMAFKQAVRRRRPGAAGADHAARHHGARGERGRRDRRHDQPPRPRAGDGSGPGRHHRARRGADGRGARPTRPT